MDLRMSFLLVQKQMSDKYESIKSTCACLEYDIIILNNKLKETESQEEIEQIKTDISQFEDDLKDLLLDLAILQEIEKQKQYREEESECYDPRYEIFTAEDY
jgi:hypothetical protein